MDSEQWEAPDDTKGFKARGGISDRGFDQDSKPAWAQGDPRKRPRRLKKGTVDPR